MHKSAQLATAHGNVTERKNGSEQNSSPEEKPPEPVQLRAFCPQPLSLSRFCINAPPTSP